MVSILNICLLVKRSAFLGHDRYRTASTLLLALGLWWFPAWLRAAPLPPADRRLVAAFRQHDEVKLSRAARQLRVAGLLAALEGKNRELRAAALSAAPFAEKSWLLLPWLVEAIYAADRAVARAAARATRLVAEDLRHAELQDYEDFPNTLAPLGRRLAELSADRTISGDVRVEAILALAQLIELAPLPLDRLAPLLLDPEPALRRAAAETLARPSDPERQSTLARMVATDPSPAAARAAAAALCAQVSLKDRDAKEPEALLRCAPRLRDLASDDDATKDQLLDIARCLLRLRSAADRQALRALLRHAPTLERRVQQMKD